MHPDRKAAIHAAVRHLASHDEDRAREINGVGYNQTDSRFGAELAKQSTLSDRQAEAAAQMLQKYKRQLGGTAHHLLHDKHWGSEGPPEPKFTGKAPNGTYYINGVAQQ